MQKQHFFILCTTLQLISYMDLYASSITRYETPSPQIVTPRLRILTGSISLFNDPITTHLDQLLQQPCTAEITEQALATILPCFKTKTDLELSRYKLSIVQQFALNNLLECLLRRCDTIINDPRYNLSEQRTIKNTSNSFVILKRFQDFPIRSTEQFFLKYYKFLGKLQDSDCWIPEKLDPQIYLHTAELDHFFESSLDETRNEENLKPIENPIKIHLWQTILDLAKLADKLEEKAISTNEPCLKHRRIET